MKMLLIACVCMVLLAAPLIAVAGEADVLSVKAQPAGQGRWQFSVSVAHADDGWDHYADGWEILDEVGDVLDSRVLAHPHVTEQPFTRSLTTDKIPATLKAVTIRAHCSVHGHGGKRLRVNLTP